VQHYTLVGVLKGTLASSPFKFVRQLVEACLQHPPASLWTWGQRWDGWTKARKGFGKPGILSQWKRWTRLIMFNHELHEILLAQIWWFEESETVWECCAGKVRIQPSSEWGRPLPWASRKTVWLHRPRLKQWKHGGKDAYPILFFLRDHSRERFIIEQSESAFL
jgi:hypothetical protein